MLVLSRRNGESIMICNNVEVAVVSIRGNKVRLGITAPKAISVHRKEVHEAISKDEAAKTHNNF